MDVSAASSSNSVASSIDGRGGSSGGNSEFLGNLGMFGQPSGVSDLLLGNSGFSGSLANGYGNDTSNSNNTGQANASTFDLNNDFPSLGGGGGVTNSASNSASSTNGLAAALRQQQQLLAHQQLLQGGNKNVNSSNLYRLAMQSGANGGANFSMATEDFPALPGAPPSGGGNGGTNGSLSAPGNSPLLLGGNGSQPSSLPSSSASAFGTVPTVSRTASGGSGAGLYTGDLSGENNQIDSNSLLGNAGVNNLGGLTGLQAGSTNPSSSLGGLQQRSSTPSSTPSGNAAPVSAPGAAAGSALSGDYGLLGLLSVIRMTDADRNALALGTDLTMLGLNLNTNENLYTNFASPFSESQSTKEPFFQLPMCYYMQAPALKTGHLSKFQLETLFYIFYGLPKDVLQAYAAQELHSRDWRYHGELKRWFKRDSSSGSSQFLYFDINSWERHLFTGNLQNITSGFLTEEEVRVKFANS